MAEIIGSCVDHAAPTGDPLQLGLRRSSAGMGRRTARCTTPSTSTLRSGDPDSCKQRLAEADARQSRLAASCSDSTNDSCNPTGDNAPSVRGPVSLQQTLSRLAGGWVMAHRNRWPAHRRRGPQGTRTAQATAFARRGLAALRVSPVVSVVEPGEGVGRRDLPPELGPPDSIGRRGCPTGVFLSASCWCELARASGCHDVRPWGRTSIGRWTSCPPCARRCSGPAGYDCMNQCSIEALHSREPAR